MSQNIVLFLKIKLINLLIFLLYPLFYELLFKKKTNKYLINQSNWSTFIVASLRITPFKGNVNECRTALVKNLIKESFYGKRKKSN